MYENNLIVNRINAINNIIDEDGQDTDKLLDSLLNSYLEPDVAKLIKSIECDEDELFGDYFD